ncbi:hypothetical protein NDU88_006294 [Pleurodeles waltl]|uniref:Uncharacterized protein n=1 Tax=Pleurodeles waltl TaxID=8319 RepID=A0AAV7SP44_PLEWA|nr:hypothetical protein NDU88_006294 [Pleurodeles waltl]
MSLSPAPGRPKNSKCSIQNAMRDPRPDPAGDGATQRAPRRHPPAREAKTRPARPQGRVQIPPQQEASTPMADPGEPPPPKSPQPARPRQVIRKPGSVRSLRALWHQGGAAPHRIRPQAAGAICLEAVKAADAWGRGAAVRCNR